MNLNTGHTEDGMLFSVTFAKYSDGTVILESADLLPTWVYLGTSPVTGKWEYNLMPLDDSVSDWYAQLQLTDSMYASCKASYDRTMAIVGSGMARIWNPASSMRWMIFPVCRALTASGLIIANVVSISCRS